MKTFILKNEFYTMTVSEIGAEPISLKANDGFEYLWQNTKDYWDMHAPILFPICGSLNGNKYTLEGKEYEMFIHGFLMFKTFTPVVVSDTRLVLEYASNEETLKVYPFDFKFVAEYTLDGEDIHFDYTVTNTSDKLMPYMFGWHPGFTLPTDEGQDINDYEIGFGDVSSVIWHPLANVESIAPSGMVRRELINNTYRLCEKEIYEQDTMIFTEHEPHVTMHAEGHPYRLSLEWSENIPTLCIWKWPTNDSKFVCIEPWASYPKDGVTDENFDTRPMPRLEAGKSERYTYTLKITK